MYYVATKDEYFDGCIIEKDYQELIELLEELD